MKTLVIGFSKPKNKCFPIFSWAIRFIEQTPYSHVYVRWRSDKLERDLVYQASGTMVNFMEGSRFDNQAETTHKYELEISEYIKLKVVKKAVDNAGAPYGMKQVIGILLVKLARLMGKDIKNPFSDGKATWVCSEIVLDALKELGMEMKIHPDNVTPRDIKEYLSSLNG